MNKKLITLFATYALFAFALSACTTDQPADNNLEETATPIDEMEAVTPQATSVLEEEGDMGAEVEDANVKEFTVTGSNFEFDVKEIRVNQGDIVRINFVNGGGMHDWVIDEFNARTQVLEETGAEETIEFVADEAGTFEYYCSVMEHRAMGMVGNLIVE